MIWSDSKNPAPDGFADALRAAVRETISTPGTASSPVLITVEIKRYVKGWVGERMIAAEVTVVNWADGQTLERKMISVKGARNVYAIAAGKGGRHGADLGMADLLADQIKREFK